MRKIWIIDESLDKMGGVERILNSISNYLIGKYDIEIISLYRNHDNPFFKYDDKIKFNYLYDKRNLISKRFKKIKLMYYFIRIFEKINEFLSIKIKAKKYSKIVSGDNIIIYGRVETALEFLPYVKSSKKTIVREAIHLEYHKEKNKIKKNFINKVDCFIISSDENMKSYNEFFQGKVNLVKIYNPLTITPKIIPNVDSKCVISVGRYDTHKGYDYLIRAWKIVNKKYPEWNLSIVGDGYYKDKMNLLINDLKLNSSISLVNPTKDIVSELNKASIYVMASRFEGYANALVEAMSCGLSCISFNWLMGAEEIIINNKNGLIVNLTDRYRYFKTLNVIAEDINNLANSIIYLIENKSIREKFRMESPKIHSSRDKKKIIEKWVEIIEGD